MLIDLEDLRTELGLDSMQEGRDDILVDLLERAISWVEATCNQPINAEISTAFPFRVSQAALSTLLPFRPVNEVLAVRRRPSPFEEWSTISDVAILNDQGVYSLACESFWQPPMWYEATLSIGYTKQSLPGVIKQVLIEWMHLRYLESRNTGDKRFGKIAAGDGKQGLNSSTTYDADKLEQRWIRTLSKGGYIIGPT